MSSMYCFPHHSMGTSEGERPKRGSIDAKAIRTVYNRLNHEFVVVGVFIGVLVCLILLFSTRIPSVAIVA